MWSVLYGDFENVLTKCSLHKAKPSLSLDTESILSPDVVIIQVSETILALGTESGSVLGPEHLGMLSEAAERRKLLLLYHRADVRLGATYAAREGA